MLKLWLRFFFLAGFAGIRVCASGVGVGGCELRSISRILLRPLKALRWSVLGLRVSGLRTFSVLVLLSQVARFRVSGLVAWGFW